MIPIIDTLLGTLSIALPIMVIMYIDEVVKKMRELRAKILMEERAKR
jgi:hypothetical protein